MNVQDVMTAEVISVRAETPLKEVARLLAEHGISGVPVLDDREQVIGVVSEADFLLKEQAGTRRQSGSLLWWLTDRNELQRAERKLRATTAGEIMTSPAITVAAERPLREAAALMTRHRINRLPVVDGGRLVGIVTRADMVETFLVPDDELRQRIQSEVVRDTMWMDETEVKVSVVDGVARLEGTVDRRSTAMILERLVRHVDGAVGVESHLGWGFDDRTMTPVGEIDREPTAASVTARERPRR